MSKRLENTGFITRSVKAHGQTYIYSKVKYVDAHTKVCIVCRKHGDYWQAPNHHFKGHGCPKCALEKVSESYKMLRPDMSHVQVPKGSAAVAVGTEGKFALVDEEDYDRVNKLNWKLSSGGYAVNKRFGQMHRFIMDVSNPTIFVDHKYHNKLDNRKSMLRLCDNQKNQFNQRPKKGSSSYKGVRKSGKKWRAGIKVNGKDKSLGTFGSEIEAAIAYDNAAIKYRGEFARINFTKGLTA